MTGCRTASPKNLMVTKATFQVRALALAYKFWGDTIQSTAVEFKFFKKKEVFFFLIKKKDP